jgi:hypothetical protein
MKNPFLMAAATLLALGLAHTGSAQGQKLTLSGQAISAYNDPERPARSCRADARSGLSLQTDP